MSSGETEEEAGGGRRPPPLGMLCEICTLIGWCKEEGGREGGNEGGGGREVGG